MDSHSASSATSRAPMRSRFHFGCKRLHTRPGNSLKVASKTKVPTNEWVHVAVTYDGSSRARGLKLFINGALAETEVTRDGLWKEITYAGDEPGLVIGYRFRD